jgi:hypothetical protein
MGNLTYLPARKETWAAFHMRRNDKTNVKIGEGRRRKDGSILVPSTEFLDCMQAAAARVGHAKDANNHAIRMIFAATDDPLATVDLRETLANHTKEYGDVEVISDPPAFAGRVDNYVGNLALDAQRTNMMVSNVGWFRGRKLSEFLL